MQQLIDHVRSKPHHQRSRIVWATAGIAVAVLLALWLILGNAKTPEDANFFRTFNQGFQDGKDDFRIR